MSEREKTYDTCVGVIKTFAMPRKVAVSAEGIKRFDCAEAPRRIFARMYPHPPKRAAEDYVLVCAFAEGRDIVEACDRINGTFSVYRTYGSTQDMADFEINPDIAQEVLRPYAEKHHAN